MDSQEGIASSGFPKEVEVSSIHSYFTLKKDCLNTRVVVYCAARWPNDLPKVLTP